ncbi:hypothetical protein BKA61DRAFT_566458 [Leptodontidium sp. MPI-SDFR-AT-0119]|nr:hypothetical protein BKA61DRAFT_566458 [Leptodontidium sp. MPI-SDFR-AT-0119]
MQFIGKKLDVLIQVIEANTAQTKVNAAFQPAAADPAVEAQQDAPEAKTDAKKNLETPISSTTNTTNAPGEMIILDAASSKIFVGVSSKELEKDMKFGWKELDDGIKDAFEKAEKDMLELAEEGAVKMLDSLNSNRRHTQNKRLLSNTEKAQVNDQIPTDQVSTKEIAIHEDGSGNLGGDVNNLGEKAMKVVGIGVINVGNQSSNIAHSIQKDEKKDGNIKIPSVLPDLPSVIIGLAEPFLNAIVDFTLEATVHEIQRSKQGAIDAMYDSIKDGLSQATGLHDVDINCECANVKHWIKEIKGGKATLGDMEMGLSLSEEGQDFSRLLHAKDIVEKILQKCMEVLAARF